MELFVTVILIILSFVFSVYLIAKGIRLGKKSINELKNGQN